MEKKHEITNLKLYYLVVYFYIEHIFYIISESLVSLLLCLVKKCPAVCNISHFVVLLGAYGATLSTSGKTGNLSTFSLTTARLFVRVQHGGQEQRMAAGHHVQGGQRYQILLDFTATIHQFQQVAQSVQKVLISVAISAEGEYLLGH